MMESKVTRAHPLPLPRRSRPQAQGLFAITQSARRRAHKRVKHVMRLVCAVGSSPVPDSGVFPSPSASPEPSSGAPIYPSSFADRFLPSIRGRPFTHGLGANLSAGLTVALINVPLSLSLAVASATTPQAGILTAVWGQSTRTATRNIACASHPRASLSICTHSPVSCSLHVA